MSSRTDIKEFSLPDLEAEISQNGFSSFHAKQIFSWIYKKASLDFSSMSNIPLDLRSFLDSHFLACSSTIKDIQKSKDGTIKYAVSLADNNVIETVYIPAENRGTLCLSSQVGCRFGCTFCASASCAWIRNLKSCEILDQILIAKNNFAGRITHIVFMGIGEPLDNLRNCLRAISIINSPRGFDIGKRRITISTCGIIPGIERLAKGDILLELSVSLHAPDDNRRSLIMPINKKYPLAMLMQSLRRYQQKTDRQITFEYALMKDFNTRSEDVAVLKKILAALDCKLNLILLNPVVGSRSRPATIQDALRFSKVLKRANIRATVRQPRGQDILAACGQLRSTILKKDS
jgi:23S rRNA (adenine2503-C2)-methyltransferase